MHYLRLEPTIGNRIHVSDVISTEREYFEILTRMRIEFGSENQSFAIRFGDCREFIVASRIPRPSKNHVEHDEFRVCLKQISNQARIVAPINILESFEFAAVDCPFVQSD